MSKITGFYDSLKKSTKITVLSCGSFVVMIMIILAFFILFPITPSEKIMTNIGRGENMFQENGEPVQSGVPTVETTVSTAPVTTTKVTTTKPHTTRARTTFTINITTGSGFSMNGRIPTGGMPGYTETYTTPVDPSEPVDPSNPLDPNQGQGVTNPVDPNQGQGVTNPVDPNQGQGVTNPDPNQGGATPDPNQGGVTPDPNQGGVTPDPNQGATPTPSVTPDAGTW